MFRVHNKDTKMTPDVELWTYFTPCYIVSIVNFEHVIADWELFILILEKQGIAPRHNFSKDVQWNLHNILWGFQSGVKTNLDLEALEKGVKYV